MTNPFSKNNKKSFNLSELISNRESLITDVKDLWNKLYLHNITPNGATPQFDLNAIYKTISEKELAIVNTKLGVQAANMGFKNLTQLPKNCVYVQIYLLQQLKERKVKLEKLPTRKNEAESVTFTNTFVSKELISLKYQIEKIESELTAYNSSVSFELPA
jgi:hypothetical protein